MQCRGARRAYAAFYVKSAMREAYAYYRFIFIATRAHVAAMFRRVDKRRYHYALLATLTALPRRFVDVDDGQCYAMMLHMLNI